MIVGTSALLAIAWDEPERARFEDAIEAHPVRRILAASALEGAIVVMRRSGGAAAARALARLHELLDEPGLEIEPVSAGQIRIAEAAYLRFGKGLHPAGLNFGNSSPMRWPGRPASRSCSRATTSPRPTWCAPDRRRLCAPGPLSPRRWRAALAAVHEAASDPHDAGVMGKRTLREFDELCLTPVRPMTAADIRALRARARQPARVRASSECHHRPDQPVAAGREAPGRCVAQAANLVDRRGLAAIA